METKVNHFQWKLGGEAGFGIKITGQMFSRLCVRGGLYTFDYTEYPSLIRGGHNSYQIIVSDQPVHAPVWPVDLLVALNRETVDLHREELAPGAGILFDSEQKGMDLTELRQEGTHLFPVPLVRLAKEAGGTAQMRNVVALGATVGIVNYAFRYLEEVIHVAFDRKGEKIVEANIKAARAGYAFAEEHFSERFPFVLKPLSGKPKRMMMTGNTAVALGAIQARCQYYAGYPMTPSTSILTTLAKHAEKTGMVVRHAEDEIAAINSAIGASYAGARAMVGTAGGGFALMVEGLGLAAMLETPLVIFEGMRPGPATGLPTWTGQGDLQFLLHAAQDEFPRILLAPGDTQEAFHATVRAFDLADKFQVPVFVVSDKFLGESAESIEPFSTDHLGYDRGLIEHAPTEEENGLFKRYRFTSSGVSPRVLPGTLHGAHIANSDEHDEFGFVVESSEGRVLMMDKRLRKLTAALSEIPLPTIYGPQHADLTIVCWGSTKGPAIDALEMLEREGLKVNVLHFLCVHPLPVDRLVELFRHTTATLIVEGNATGQFAQHLKAHVGVIPEATLFKYDGRPFFPHEIANKVREFFHHNA